MWYAEERISRESVSGSPSKTAQEINGEEPMIMTRIQTLTLLMLTLALALPSTSFSDTFTITTGEDVAPYQFLPNNNRGTYTTMYAFSGTGGHDFESYINFDLSGVALPQGHVVTNATFFIAYAFDFTAFGDTNQDPGNLIVYRVDESWGEMTLTWANRPSATVAVDQVDEQLQLRTLRKVLGEEVGPRDALARRHLRVAEPRPVDEVEGAQPVGALAVE